MDPLFFNITDQDDDYYNNSSLDFPLDNNSSYRQNFQITTIVRRFMEKYGFEVKFLNGTNVNELCLFSSNYFLLMYLLPAVFILLLLSFVERRQRIFPFEKRFQCLSGRFGVVVPLDFTSSLENRWSYAFAFGAVTPLIFSLLFGFTNPFPYTPPRYLKVFVYLIAALQVGIVCKPFFVCLSTPHQMLGGILGLPYTISWFIVQVCDLMWCMETSPDDQDSLLVFSLQYEWLFAIPHLLCLGILTFRFGFMIVKDILIHLKKQSEQKEVKKHQYRHVQRLLRRPAEVSVQKSWFQRNVYEWDPYFKFPNRIIATVVLSFLGVYLIVLTEQIISSWCTKSMYGRWMYYINNVINGSVWITHLNYVTYTWYTTSVCATVLSVIHISHVMLYYRKHIKSLWAGDKQYELKTYKLRPAVSVAGLLKYPGYQIAFTIWGYLIVHLALFTAGLVFVYVVLFPIRQYGFLTWLLDVCYFLTNFFIVFILMRLQRFMIRKFFLQDKNSPEDEDKPLALNNRKVFHNFNYYLFFFNVMLGMGSCVLRLIRSAAVALILLPHIERTIMPQGFKKLDAGHNTWVGMLIMDHHHNHPVLVCFCHLLLKRTLCRVRGDEDRKPEPPANTRAHIHWFLVYTLLRNPKLILLRKTRWLTHREVLEHAFIWAMKTQRHNQHTSRPVPSALTLISAVHSPSLASDIYWEGLRRMCPP